MKNVLLLSALGMMLTACATAPDAYRTTASNTDCKATYTSSAAEQIANGNKAGVPGSNLEKDYAVSKLAQLQLNNPRLRERGPTNTIDDTIRDCN